MGFPLLSQFVGLRRDPQDPQSVQNRDCHPLVPPKLQVHMEDGPHGTGTRSGIQRVAAGAMALRGHRELCPAMGQPGDTGRDLNTFTGDREE